MKRLGESNIHHLHNQTYRSVIFALNSISAPVPEKRWEEVFKGNSLDFRQEFFVIDGNTGGLVVNTPTTVKLLMTVDGGKTWTETDTKLSTIEVRSVAFQDKNTGYISLFGKGVYRTLDGGKTWEMIHDCTCGITADSNSVSIVDGYYTYYSTDKGETFTEKEAGFLLFQNPVSSFRFGKKVIFVFSEGLLISEDSGINWENPGNNFNHVSGVAAINSTNWYLVSGSSLYVTENAGDDWTELAYETNGYIPAAKNDTLLVHRSNHIQWTTDGKNFFTDDDDVRNIHMFAIGNNILGFGNDRIYRRK